MRPRVLPVLAVILVLLFNGCATQPTVTPTSSEPIATGNSAPIPHVATDTSAPVELVELDVFAAASLTEPFNEIGHMFESTHPGVTVVFNYAGSQQLAQQINAGAPADVFASANNTQMNTVIVAGGIVDGSQQVFVKNRLVVIYPVDNPAGLSRLQDLANPGLKLVFAAPEVPVGQYSADFLEKTAADPAFGASFQDDVLHNVVSYEDNVKAVLTKVVLGEADGGIVYSSDISGADAGKVGRIDIPDELNVIASYPIARVKESGHTELATAFIELVLSQEGQEALASFNFIPVTKPTSGN